MSIERTFVARNKRERRVAEGFRFDPDNLTREQFALIQSKGALPHPKEGDHFLHPQEPRRTRFHIVPLGLH